MSVRTDRQRQQRQQQPQRRRRQPKPTSTSNSRSKSQSNSQSDLPDEVRLDVVIGTVSSQIPTEYLSSKSRMREVKVKMLTKVEKEVDAVIEKAVGKWRELNNK